MGHVVVNLDWWNEKVCRNFLFGTCPHLIFGNTVSDGCSTLPCSLYHQLALILILVACTDLVPADGPRAMP